MENKECKLQEMLAGNTLAVANRYGPSLIHFDRKGQFRQVGQQGQSSEGLLWTSDDRLFITVTILPEGVEPKEYSLDMNGRILGSSWTEVDPRNGLISYKLLKGHPNFKA